MTKKTIKTLIFFTILGATSSAFACGVKLKSTRVHQNRQIAKAVKNGRIDKKELKRLKKGQNKVLAMKRRALQNDGVISPKEARKITRLQKKQHRRLKHFKNAGL